MDKPHLATEELTNVQHVQWLRGTSSGHFRCSFGHSTRHGCREVLLQREWQQEARTRLKRVCIHQISADTNISSTD